MNTTPQEETPGTELIATARLIDDYRKALPSPPSDRSWLKMWPALGSTKLWSSLLRGTAEKVSAQKRLAHYKGVLAALRANIDKRGEEELYSDLSHVEVAALATLRLLHHHGKDRLIIIEGTSGSGKTSILTLISQGEAAGSYYGTEADECWSNIRNACHSLLTMLGYGSTQHPIPYGKKDRQDLLLKAISEKGRITIGIDEAHHFAPSVLNLIKTILNRTDAIIIIAGMETLFQKLRAAASEEAKQLYHNRLFARISLDTPAELDVRLWLSRRLECSHEGEIWKRGTINKLCRDSRNLGMWSYIRKTADVMIDCGHTGERAEDSHLLNAAEEAALTA